MATIMLVYTQFNPAWSQCSPSAFTVSSTNLVVNTYHPGTASVAAGAVSITVGAATGSATSISKGDLLLVIQMQGSTINSTNSNAYGDGVAGNPSSGYLTSVAGTYEYMIAANSVAPAGGTVYFTSRLTNAYTSAVATATDGAYSFQVIRVPRYSSLTFTGINNITSTPWNGNTGGVVAFDVTNAMTLNSNPFVSVSAQGFRGGGGRQLSGGAGANTDIRTLSTVNVNGAKGEGIAGTPRYLRSGAALINTGVEGYPNGSNGNGAPGNAGGGATDGNPANNDENAGGGGGGNGGAGGRGGRTWNSARNIGGYGGVAPTFLAASRLIAGGGGGAGSTNDGTGSSGGAGLSSSGGTGGGIVLIRVGSIVGSGTINANGQNGYSVDNDGGGGGGAGGTVYITSVATAGLANVTVNVTGGTGGNAWPSQPDAGAANDGNPEHGPGGGGGGGAIYSNANLVAGSSVAGGANGITTTSNRAFSAAAGSVGIKNQAVAVLPVIRNITCDIDDDDDGIPDIGENAAGVDEFGDADADGIPNLYDPTPGGGIPAFIDANADGINDAFDTDHDGIINSLDLDSDNDGIPDIIEAGGTDSNNDGIADSLTDTDSDGLVDTYDVSNGGIDIPNGDTDKDGIPNARDLDADGDGILDVKEAGLADANNDGLADGTLGSDGWSDTVDALASLNLPNTDSRGPANYLDIDSDDDGLTDNVEAQSTVGYLLPSGSDLDKDGIDDNYDNDDAAFAGNANNGLTPYNHEGTDSPDYLDSDSDNDGVNDLKEGTGVLGATLTITSDTDNDGLLDQFDTFDLVTQITNLQDNVTISGIGNGSSSSGPALAGSNVIANQTNISAPNRDWRNSLFVLSVEFISIRLHQSGDNYILSWTVAAEESVREYIVERSTNGIDFSPIGSIDFRAGGTGSQDYQYTDNNPPISAGGVIYYRIREVDQDGRYSFSAVVSSRQANAGNKLIILGNPVSSKNIELSLSSSRAGVAVVRLIDAHGRVLAIMKLPVIAGVNRMQLTSGTFLAKGIYFVEANIDGLKLIERVQINRQ